MKKAIFIILLITLASIAFVYAGSNDTSPDKKEQTVDLLPPEVAEFTTIASTHAQEVAEKTGTAVEGTLQISTERSYYRNNMEGEVWLYNLPLNDNDNMYEVWLVDVHSGYKLSVGMFSVRSTATQRFSFNHPSYANEYDKIVITLEEYPDTDPRPGDTVVLVGDLNMETLLHRAVDTSERATYYPINSVDED